MLELLIENDDSFDEIASKLCIRNNKLWLREQDQDEALSSLRSKSALRSRSNQTSLENTPPISYSDTKKSRLLAPPSQKFSSRSPLLALCFGIFYKISLIPQKYSKGPAFSQSTSQAKLIKKITNYLGQSFYPYYLKKSTFS